MTRAVCSLTPRPDETSYEAGIKVQLHAQSEPPFLDQLGFGVAPGFQTFVSTQEQRVVYSTVCLSGLAACHNVHCSSSVGALNPPKPLLHPTVPGEWSHLFLLLYCMCGCGNMQRLHCLPCWLDIDERFSFSRLSQLASHLFNFRVSLLVVHHIAPLLMCS